MPHEATSRGSRCQSTDTRLLRAGLAEADLCCAIQAVVVARYLDQSKGQLLPACGPEPASEWRVTPQAFPQTQPSATRRFAPQNNLRCSPSPG